MYESGLDDNYFREKRAGSMVRNRLMLVLCGIVLLYLAVGIKATEATILSQGDPKTHKRISPVDRLTRAEIVDREGVLVATNLRAASAYINPQEIMSMDEALLSLSTVLRDLDTKKIAREAKKSQKFVWVKRNITPKEQKAINDLGIPGVYFHYDRTRIYPQANLLSHILGYVDVDNQGLAGVEREFNDLLEYNKGEPLQLSIDVKLQNIMRDELAMRMIEHDATGAAGMIIDIQTGEVLALVSLPDFDPNKADIASSEQKFNRITLGTYEMGSVFKPITAAMAIDDGSSTMQSIFDATNPIVISGKKISDYHAKKRVLTLPEVIMYSSNIGTAKMAMGVGTVKMQKFFDKMGLFEKSGIEIPEKTKPQRPKVWKDINTMTISFGHGFAPTVANMAEAFIPLLNGGTKYPITVIKRKPGEHIESTRVLTQATSNDIRTLMRMTVQKGTGGKANATGYDVGGKTGTAEKLVGGRYSNNKVMSSFIGAFPIQQPKYLIIAILDEPNPGKDGARPTGGMVAAPIVKNVVTRTATMLGLEPKYAYTETQPDDAAVATAQQE